MATLGNQLFLVNDDGNKIDVFDATTFTLESSFDCPGLPGYGNDEYSMAICVVYNVLYVSNMRGKCVHRIVLSDTKIIATWNVPGGPRGISINGSNNVLVTCFGMCCIVEMTTHGGVLRRIQLCRNIKNPCHSIELPSGLFAVSAHQHVYLVGQDGADIAFFYITGIFDYFNQCLAVDESTGFLLIGTNGRILLLDPLSTKNVREILLPVEVDGEIGRNARVLCLDCKRGRLLVSDGDWVHRAPADYRLLVFDNFSTLSKDRFVT